MTPAARLPASRRQPLWLRWLLLVCLLGLQVHAPSHALSHVAAALSESDGAGLYTDSGYTDNDHGRTSEASAHAGSPVIDCCPAGLLAISHGLTAPAQVQAVPVAVASIPLAYSPAPVFSPYLSRAPPSDPAA